MKKFFYEFKEFAVRGNALNLAVGVLIGGAFQGIVSSLTENVLSPILGMFSGKDLNGALQIPLYGDSAIKLGAFLTSIGNFIIMAFVVFLIVKLMNTLMSLGKKEEEDPAALTTKKCPFCITEISIAASRCPACTSELPMGVNP